MSSHESHALFWWAIKVICGVLLVIGLLARYLLFPALQQWSISPQIGQLLVVSGVAIYVWHFMLVKRHNSQMQQPDRLVVDQGFYGLIRHPMYLADMIYYLGLALLWFGVASLVILLIAWLALICQAKVEDAWCANRFGSQHAAWSQTTKLILPKVY